MKPHSLTVFVSIIVLFLNLFSASSADAADETDGCAVGTEHQLVVNSLEDLPTGQLRPLVAAHFADPTGLITFDEITAQNFAELPCSERIEIQGPHGALWLRFSLENPNDQPTNWVVAFMENIFDEMVLYEQTATGLVLRAENGRMIPRARRSDLSINTALPVTMVQNHRADYYVRVSGTFAEHVTPVLVSANMFERWEFSFTAVLLIILGPMALLVIFSLILFRNVISVFYKYYTLYISSAFLFIFVTYGWVHWLFDVQIPITITVRLIEFAVGVSVLANIQYCRVMLLGEQNQGRLGFVILTGVALFFCCIALINPWRFAMPNHLMLFISPIVLFCFFLRQVRRVPHAWAVCASLFCLICGLATANYYFLAPPSVPETSSVWEVMFTRFGTFSYGGAVIGESVFMMVAISIMLRGLRSRSQLAFAQLKELRRALVEIESASAQAVETAEARVRLMQEGVGDSDQQHLRPIETRFEEQAKAIIIDHIGVHDFGSKALAKALGMSERTLGRRTSELLEITPAALIRHTRLTLAHDLLLLRQYNTVAEVAFATGFSSVSHFAKLYRTEFMTTPSETLRSRKLKTTAA